MHKQTSWQVLLSVFLSVAMSLAIPLGIALAGTTPSISSNTYKVGNNKIFVQFNEPVWASSSLSGALAAADFAIANDGSGSGTGFDSISSVAHTAGNDYAVLTMNAVAVSADSATLIKPVANSIFTAGGALSEKNGPALTSDSTAPTISSVIGAAANTKLMVTFSEPVFGASDASSSIAAADFTYNDDSGDNAGSISSASALNDTTYAILTTNAALTEGAFGDIGIDSISPVNGGDDIFDVHGNAAVDADTALATETTKPTFTVEAVVGRDNAVVTFSEPVFTAADCSTVLTNSDFTYSNESADGAASVEDALSTSTGASVYVIDLNADIASTDLASDTVDVAADATAVFDCAGNGVDSSAATLDDTTDPVLLSATKTVSSSKNILTLLYSEPVQTTGFTSGSTSIASTTSVGDMTSSCTVAGFGSFASGDFTFSSLGNTVANNSGQTQFTITLAGQAGANRIGGNNQCTGTFTPVAIIRDVHDAANVVEVTSLLTTITTTNNWEVFDNQTSNAVLPTVPANFGATVNEDGQVVLTWTDPKTTGFKEVKIFRGLSPAPVDGGSAFAVVTAGKGTYTDTNVKEGDVVSYILKAYNSDGNASAVTETVTITVKAGESVKVESTESDSAQESTTTESTETTTEESTEEGATEFKFSNTNPPANFDEEKEAVQERGFVTVELDKATNKCESLVMMARVAGWEVDENDSEDGFTDTPSWCKPYAKAAKELGVVSGRSEGLLGANESVSRYEVALMMARALGKTEAELAEAAKMDSPYQDEIVEWARGAVYWLHAEGIMTGYPDGTFGGDKAMLKVEVAVGLTRAFGTFK